MTDAFTKTVIGSFGQAAAAGGSIVLEIDAAMHLDSEGNERSDFLPGEGVYFLIHHRSSITIKKVRATDGGDVQKIGKVTRDAEQEVSFTHPAMTGQLGHLPRGSVTASWYGRTSPLKREGQDISASGAPCLGKLSYRYEAVQYLHRPPAGVSLDADGQWLSDIVVEYEAAT